MKTSMFALTALGLATAAAFGAIGVGAALLGIGVAAAAGIGSSCVMIVDQQKEVVLESFGKFSETKTKPGIQLKFPWPFQNIAAVISTQIEQVKETLETKTKDDVFVNVPIKIQHTVIDSQKYTYGARRPDDQMATIVASAVKQNASRMAFAELYEAREEISHKVKESVGKEVEDKYGIRIVDVIIDQPKAPDSIEKAYSDVMASEKRLTATRNTSEAEKIRTIKDAEARKEAQRLLGEGIAEQRAAIFSNYANQFNTLVKQGVTEQEANKIMVLAMTQDTLREIGEKGNVIITTTNPTDILAQFQALGKSLGTDQPVMAKTAAKDGPQPPSMH